MAKNRIVQGIPNTITSLNALSGCMSVIYAFNDQLVIAGALIMVAAIFDFFDGFAARMLNSYSPIGKELDSLADAISFGFAPTIIAFHLLKNSLGIDDTTAIPLTGYKLMVYIPLIMAVFSILRLAKFNVDTRQTDSFIGLPTPANAIMWAFIPFAIKYNSDGFFASFINQPYIIIGLSIVMSALLVVELPLFSLKFKNFSFKENAIRYLFLTISLVFMIVFTYSSIPLIILLYVLLSLRFK